MQRCGTFQVTVAGNRIELGRNNRASLVSVYALGFRFVPGAASRHGAVDWRFNALCRRWPSSSG